MELNNAISQISSRYLWSISLKQNRSNLLLSSSRNFLQNWPHTWLQTMSQEMQENWNNACILFDYHGLKLGIISNRNKRNLTSSWKLQNLHYWMKNGSRLKLRRILKTFLNWTKMKTQHNQTLWDIMNVVLRGKFVEQSASFKNKKWRDIILTSLTAHLKDLQQTENLTPRRSR